MFHKVVQQHLYGVVGYLVTAFVINLLLSPLVKKFCKSVSILAKLRTKVMAVSRMRSKNAQ